MPKKKKKRKNYRTKRVKRNRRSQSTYPALRPELNLRTRFDLIEIDDKYWNDLKKNPKAAEWLNQFNEEFVNAAFNKYEQPLHTSIDDKRESYKRNNARNRCVYTREKAQGKLEFAEDLKMSRDEEFIEYEESLINYLDGEPIKTDSWSLPTKKKRKNLKKRSNNRNRNSSPTYKLKKKIKT